MCFLRTVDAAGGGLVHVTFAPLKDEARLVALSSPTAGGTDTGTGTGTAAPPTATASVTAVGAPAITVTGSGCGGGISGGGGGGGIPGGSGVGDVAPAGGAGGVAPKVFVSLPRPVCCTHTPIFTAQTPSSCSSVEAARGATSTWDPLVELHHWWGDGGGGGGGHGGGGGRGGHGGGGGGGDGGGGAMMPSGVVPSPPTREWAGTASTSHPMEVEMVSDGETPAATAAAMEDGGGHMVASRATPWGMTAAVPRCAVAPRPLPLLLPLPAAAVAAVTPAPHAPTAAAAAADASGYESAPDAAVDAAHASRLAAVRSSLGGTRRPHRRGRRRVHPAAPRVVHAEVVALADASNRLAALAADVAARRGALAATHDRLLRRRLSMDGRGSTAGGGGRGV